MRYLLIKKSNTSNRSICHFLFKNCDNQEIDTHFKMSNYGNSLFPVKKGKEIKLFCKLHIFQQLSILLADIIHIIIYKIIICVQRFIRFRNIQLKVSYLLEAF